ncbi:hypothetical protein H4W79_003447 [Nocardiopsis terrae]|uniref:Uncharacterized protein n=1 Tax=Nocardiopsis terrae TaxID=372655 RepID=A0ABR9HJQ9_9ACTN|nr:hypothetical protein [Nocardiopsis terrae]
MPDRPLTGHPTTHGDTMGSSSWSTDAYRARQAYQNSAGISSFG